MDTPLVQITAVLQSQPSDLLLGAELERPTSGSAFDRTTFEVSGWVVGRNAPAREVQLVSRGRVLRTIPVSAERPDIVVRFPEAPERSGFWMLAGTLGLDRTFEVEVKAVLDDGSHATIGSIRGRRSPVSTSFDPKLAPLMLTSLGRTGTTLAMSLLSAHPRIVAHRTYPYEIFPAKYWLHLLRVLAEPADHASFQPEGFTDDLWKVGYNPFHSPPVTNDPELMQLLGKTYVERLARFCEASIDDLYLAIAALQGQDSASFFLEKFQPGHIPSLAWDLYPQAKEVFLVRDFRDVICSVFAFNEKRGNVGFGRDQCASDEDYVRYVARGAEQLLHDWRQRRDLGHLVRYEDLAAQPEETTAAVLEYVGLPRSPETIDLMLRTALESPSLDKHRTSATVQESIGRWRHELPHSLRPTVREALNDSLSEFGYAPQE